jgi:hypothetical protein
LKKDFENFQKRSRKTLKIFPKNKKLDLLFKIEPISQIAPNFVNHTMVTLSCHSSNIYPIKQVFSKTQQNRFFPLSPPIGQLDCFSSSHMVSYQNRSGVATCSFLFQPLNREDVCLKALKDLF